MGKANSKIVTVVIGVVVLAVIVFGGMYLTQNLGKTDREIDEQQAVASIDRMADQVKPRKGNPAKSAIEYTGEDVSAEELPDLDNSSIAAKATTKVFAEIFASPNVAGSGTDGWLADLAEQFNSSGATVDGTPVSVQVRNVTAGLALDYISTGKAVPEALCPSNSLWVSMLEARGVKLKTVSKSMVHDVAGVLLDEEHQSALVDKYGTVDMKSITEAVAAGELSFGYTNPFQSSTGMNFLISTLLRYDVSDPLSDTAAEGFKNFQANVPLVSLTTQQMVKAASGGKLDGFVNEYQVYCNDPALQSKYQFTPFGYEHDYPLVAMRDEADATQMAIIEQFAAFCDENGAQLAKEDGFNQDLKYKSELPSVDGDTLVAAEQFYKKNKDASSPVMAVFVADMSGSMEGAPLMALQDSLVNGMKYINEENYVGLVSYNSMVTIEVPIAQFDMDQQMLFKGAVEGLSANGGTATFDGVVVAASMINEATQENPDVKPMIFVLSDGETNAGFSLSDVSATLKGLGIPIYTIGYNADIDALQAVSDINEAASINADTDDVVYQLKNLFNANM